MKTPTRAQTTPTVIVNKEPLDIRGMTFANWQTTYPENLENEMSIVQTMGMNWAAVVVTWYQDTGSSNQMFADATQTLTDSEVTRCILELKSRGFKVMLKPHLDVQGGSPWRGELTPSSPADWFSNYQAFILHYAQMAQSTSSDMFCIGCELKNQTVSSYLPNWQSIISAVRGVYTGPLTYAANGGSPTDEYNSIPTAFWTSLDYAGIDAYFGLTNQNSPSVSELAAGWSNSKTGDNVIGMITNWQATHGKPIIFTEIGYFSVIGTNQSPYNYGSGIFDESEMANCYRAFFQVWQHNWRSHPWFKGYFLWATYSAGYTTGTAAYDPTGMQAQTVITKENRGNTSKALRMP